MKHLQGWRRKTGACCFVLTLGICLIWIATSIAPYEAMYRTGDITHVSVRSARDGITIQTLRQIDPYILESGTFTTESVTLPYLSIVVASTVLSATLTF